MPNTVWTLPEAAAFLRLSPRALYALAREGRVPAALLGGKWLFPEEALRRWLLAQVEAADAARPPILAGSHDPLLEWAVRQSGCGLALRAGGSLDGLDALGAGQAVAAALHVRDPDSGAWNEPAVRAALPAAPLVGLVWAWREQGLILPAGNPLALGSVRDLARPGLRVVGRQPRAGSHVLLLHLLSEAGLRLDQIGFLAQPALAEDEVAAAVAEGRADAGFGVRAEASLRGLAFMPLARERFDLVLHRRDAFEPPVQRLLAFARGADFAARAERMGGYDVGATGAVAFNL